MNTTMDGQSSRTTSSRQIPTLSRSGKCWTYLGEQHLLEDAHFTSAGPSSTKEFWAEAGSLVQAFVPPTMSTTARSNDGNLATLDMESNTSHTASPTIIRIVGPGEASTFNATDHWVPAGARLSMVHGSSPLILGSASAEAIEVVKASSGSLTPVNTDNTALDRSLFTIPAQKVRKFDFTTSSPFCDKLGQIRNCANSLAGGQMSQLGVGQFDIETTDDGLSTVKAWNIGQDGVKQHRNTGMNGLLPDGESFRLVNIMNPEDRYNGTSGRRDYTAGPSLVSDVLPSDLASNLTKDGYLFTSNLASTIVYRRRMQEQRRSMML